MYIEPAMVHAMNTMIVNPLAESIVSCGMSVIRIPDINEAYPMERNVMITANSVEAQSIRKPVPIVPKKSFILLVLVWL